MEKTLYLLLQRPGITAFDDILKDSLKQLSNVEAYRTFTNLATDIEQPKRRDERQTHIKDTDYIVRVEILREKSYSKHFIGTIISTLTVTTIPVGYTWNYTTTVSVFGKDNELRAKYVRSASVTNWVQTFLATMHAFHTEEKKNEEVYLQMLSNIFKQIENENILQGDSGVASH